MLLNACDAADEFFIKGIEQTFARHLRGLERELRLYDQDFDHIEVVFAPKLYAGFAFMKMQEELVDSIPVARDKEGNRHTAGQRSAKARRTILLVCGTLGKSSITGDDVKQTTLLQSEWHHSIKHRLAVAHELGHIALGHLFHRDGTLFIPDEGHKPAADEEQHAMAYAVYLVKLSSEYMRRMAPHLRVSDEELYKAANAMWPDFVSSVDGQKLMRKATPSYQP